MRLPQGQTLPLPQSLQTLIDTSPLLSRAGVNTPQNICSQTALMEPLWHWKRTHHVHFNTLFPSWGQMVPTPLLPPLLVQDKSWGRISCRYRPRHACATHRWPPSGGFQRSLLSKDKLSNRLLCYEFTPRSIPQKRWRKILGLSSSTLRRNSPLEKVRRQSEKGEREREGGSAVVCKDSICVSFPSMACRMLPHTCTVDFTWNIFFFFFLIVT